MSNCVFNTDLLWLGSFLNKFLIMNYFFGIKNSYFNCEIQIPCFQNRNPKPKKIFLYQAHIQNNKWIINKLDDCKINDDFYLVKSNKIENNNNFFLAEEKDFNNFDNNRLKNFNNFTDTSPAFRANFKIFIKNGGFSSYQSEYPYSMITKRGTILSSVNSIANKDAEKNYIFIRNIFEEPIEETFNAFIVDINERKIKEKFEIKTNNTNCFELEKSLIKPENFLTTDRFIGVPIYVSIKNKHISFEHTQPQKEYIQSKNKFKKVKELKKEVYEIIYKKNSTN